MIETTPATMPLPEPDELHSARLNAKATRLARRVALATVILPFIGFLISVILLWQRAFGFVELGLLLVFYVLTTMGIGVGFHRLFAHRGFHTGTGTKVILAILGSMAAEGPILFWAAIHRRHHSYSDRKAILIHRTCMAKACGTLCEVFGMRTAAGCFDRSLRAGFTTFRTY